MKRGKGGDSLEAIRRIWMDGYNEARRELGRPPVVYISTEDLARVHELGTCGNPGCHACGPRVPVSREEEP